MVRYKGFCFLIKVWHVEIRMLHKVDSNSVPNGEPQNPQGCFFIPCLVGLRLNACGMVWKSIFTFMMN